MVRLLSLVARSVGIRVNWLLQWFGWTVVRNSPYVTFYPPGHYYSALPAVDDVRNSANVLHAEPKDIGRSIDLNAAGQEALLKNLAPLFSEFDWPELQGPGRRYYLDNSMFLGADAMACYALLRHLRPKRIIEAGSGYSSALMLDVADRYLEGGVQFTFIEPYPNRLHLLLREHDWQRCNVLVEPIQKVSLDVFGELEAGDVLFIDTSHVSKVASDVNHILFNVLPSLQPGVIVHFHDIAWPFEYPVHWLLEGRAWNEAYIVRAFLQYNTAFQVLLFNQWAQKHSLTWQMHETEAMKATLGGSLWLRKVGRYGSGLFDN